MPHTTIRLPAPAAPAAAAPRPRSQSVGPSPAAAPAPRAQARRHSLDALAPPRPQAACLRAAWTPRMLAEECFALLARDTQRPGLALWCVLLADAGLTELGPLTLGIRRSAGAPDALQACLHTGNGAATHRSVTMASPSALHRIFSGVSDTIAGAPISGALSASEAIGWLLGEAEHVPAWCRWAGPQTPAQWAALGAAAIARGQRCQRHSLARRYLREIANQCAAGQAGGPPWLPPPTPVTPASAERPAPASRPPSPAPPAAAPPVLPAREAVALANAPRRKKRAAQAAKAAHACAGVDADARVASWAEAAGANDKTKTAKFALVTQALHADSEAGAPADAWTDRLRLAGQQQPNLGWQLYREMVFALHKPSTKAVCGSLLQLPAPSQLEALGDAAAVLDAIAIQRSAADVLPADDGVLQGYVAQPTTCLPMLRALAVRDAERVGDALNAAARRDPTLIDAIVEDALAQQAKATGGAPAFAAVSALHLLGACAARLTPAKRLALLKQLDAQRHPEEGLQHATYGLLAQQMADVATIPARGRHTRAAAWMLLTRASAAELSQWRAQARRTCDAATLPVFVFDQALVESLLRGDDARAQLHALRSALGTARDEATNSAIRIDCMAETLMAGLTRLGQCMRGPRPLTTNEVALLCNFILDLWDEVAPEAERLGLQPSREAVREALRRGGLDDLRALCALLPVGGWPMGSDADEILFEGLAPLARVQQRLAKAAGAAAQAHLVTAWLREPSLRDAAAFAVFQSIPLLPPPTGCNAAARKAVSGPAASVGGLWLADARQWLYTWLSDDDGLLTSAPAHSGDVWYRLAPRLLAMLTLDGYAPFVPGEPCVVRLQQTFARMSQRQQHAVAAGLRGTFLAADKHAFFRTIGDVALAHSGPSAFCREHLLPIVVAFCRAVAPRLAAHTAHRYVAACGLEAVALQTEHPCAAADAFARRGLGLLGPYLLQATALPALSVHPAAAASAGQTQQAAAQRFADLFAPALGAEDGQASAWHLVESLLVSEQRDPGALGPQGAAPIISAALQRWLTAQVRSASDAPAAAAAAMCDVAVFVHAVAAPAAPALGAALRHVLPADLTRAARAAPGDAAVQAIAACASRWLEAGDEMPTAFAARRDALAQRRALVQLRDDRCAQSIARRLRALCDAAAADTWHLGDIWPASEAALVRVVAAPLPLADLQASVASLRQTAHNKQGLQALVGLAQAAERALNVNASRA